MVSLAYSASHFSTFARSSRREAEHGVRPYLFLTEPKLGDSPLFSVQPAGRYGLTPYSAEHECKESEYYDDDDHEAAAVRPAAVDAFLPLIPELALGLQAHDLSNAKRATISS